MIVSFREREDILHVYRMVGICNFRHFRGWLGSHENSTHEWINDGRDHKHGSMASISKQE